MGSRDKSAKRSCDLCGRSRLGSGGSWWASEDGGLLLCPECAEEFGKRVRP